MTEDDFRENNARVLAQILEPLFEWIKENPILSLIIYIVLAVTCFAILFKKGEKASRLNALLSLSWPAWGPPAALVLSIMYLSEKYDKR